MIEGKKTSCRLNHFVLWCNGWYEPVGTRDVVRYEDLKKFPERDDFENLAQILKLDGYMFVRNKQDVLSIVLGFMDELIEQVPSVRKFSALRMTVWHGAIQEYMRWTKGDFERSLLLVVRDFFKYGISSENIRLTPPVYSRKLYKMGFVCPSHFGNSYKMCNHKARKYFLKDAMKA